MHLTRPAVLAEEARPDPGELVESGVLTMAEDLPGTIRRQDRRVREHCPTRRVAGRSARVVGPGAVGARIAGLLRLSE